MESIRCCVGMAVVTCCAIIIGCGNGETFGTQEPEHISLNIMALADAAEDEAMFDSLFAPGQTPENRIDYASRTFEVNDAASITGDTATVQVTISAGTVGSANESRLRGKQPVAKAVTPASSEPVVVEWKLQKVGEEWKIVDAPLQ